MNLKDKYPEELEAGKQDIKDYEAAKEVKEEVLAMRDKPKELEYCIGFMKAHLEANKEIMR